MAAPARAHIGQHGLDHGDRAEHVDVELAPHVLQRGLFQDAFVAVARIVDQDVDRSHAVLEARDDAVDGAIVRHVEDARDGPPLRQGLEILHCLRVAHGADHLMALCQCFLRQRTPETAADACDE